MAARKIRRVALLTSGLLAGLGLLPQAMAQNFTMRLDYAVTYTLFNPNGQVDTTPPYTLCARNDNVIGLVFRYTWRNPWQEYIYTEPGQELFPWYYMQAASPNPAYVTAFNGTGTINRTVQVGLIAGSVNTGGTRQVAFRGRTSGFFGNPVQYATANVLIETQIDPPPVIYREIADGALDMPTRPWFSWLPSVQTDTFRMDIGACSSATATTPQSCGTTSFPALPLTDCDPAQVDGYCWTGLLNEHRVATALPPDTPHQYHVLGRNNCGVSNELLSTPARPFFRTAQACFVIPNGNIPDGGVVHFDASTITNSIGSTVPDLRVTVHADHADVSDLRISLTKTAPDAAGPLLLMDRPTGSGCVNGTRIQAAFADNGGSLGAGCNAWEPAISGRKAPVQALSSFASVQGAGNWRLTVEDTEADGKTGALLEWCLSTVPNEEQIKLIPAPFVSPNIFASGFE